MSCDLGKESVKNENILIHLPWESIEKIGKNVETIWPAAPSRSRTPRIPGDDELMRFFPVLSLSLSWREASSQQQKRLLLAELIKAVDLETDCVEKLQTLALGNFFRAPAKSQMVAEKSVFAPPSKVSERTMSEGLNCRLLSKKEHCVFAAECSCLCARQLLFII